MKKLQSTSETAKRVCGHTDVTKLSYKTAKDLSFGRQYNRHTLCDECTLKLNSWVEDSPKAFYRVDPVSMTGTPKQAWKANQLRLEALRAHGPVMAKLSAEQDDPLARAALAVYKMLFSINSATYWFSTQQFGISRQWLKSDVEHLIRTDLQIGENYFPASAYVYFKTYNPSGLAHVKALLEEAPEALAVQSA